MEDLERRRLFDAKHVSSEVIEALNDRTSIVRTGTPLLDEIGDDPSFTEMFSVSDSYWRHAGVARAEDSLR